MSQRLLAFSRFLLGVGVVFTANFLAATLAPQGSSLRRFDAVYRPLVLLFLAVGFCILIAWIERVPGNPLAAMGLARRRPWLRDLWVGSLVGAGMVAIAVTVVALTGTYSITVTFTPHRVKLALLVLLILLSGAMAEELSFRGYPFQRLISAIGTIPAIVVLSVLFGAVHMGNPNASLWGGLNTVLVGVLLAVAYVRTRSLWMPIAIHFWWNATLGLLFGLPVSGLAEFSVIVRGRTEGPIWLTGGSYGIEASATGAVVIAMGIVGLLACVRGRQLPPAQASISRSYPQYASNGLILSDAGGQGTQACLPQGDERGGQASPSPSGLELPGSSDNTDSQ